MNDRFYTLALSILLVLTALVTCLIVLVALLLINRQGLLIALPLSPAPTPVVVLPSTPRPSVNLQPTLIVPLPATRAATGGTPLLIIPTVPTSTPVPATATPPPTPTRRRPTPTQGPSPTPTLPAHIRYLPDGPVRPDASRGCLGGAIFGTVRDTEGRPMAGVKVKVYNQYWSGISGPSKPVNAPDAGFYDLILNTNPQTWWVVVVDELGNPISPEVEVVHPVGVDICYFQVDWRAVR